MRTKLINGFIISKIANEWELKSKRRDKAEQADRENNCEERRGRTWTMWELK